MLCPSTSIHKPLNGLPPCFKPEELEPAHSFQTPSPRSGLSYKPLSRKAVEPRPVLGLGRFYRWCDYVADPIVVDNGAEVKYLLHVFPTPGKIVK